MEICDIVREKLKFLETDYGFSYNFSEERGLHFIYVNTFGYVEFYEWAQFNEYEIRVQNAAYFSKYAQLENKANIHGIYFKRILLKETYKNEIKIFKKQHKGIKWWFKSLTSDWWQMIADIVKKEISTSNTVFGLPITK